MPRLSLEKRIEALEKQIAEMNVDKANGPTKNWRRTVGKFPELQEVFAEAMKLREADRKQSRKRLGKC